MEQTELELVEKYKKENPELDKLWTAHLNYEKQLEELTKIQFPTIEDETRIKDIKKMKLAGKTRLNQLLEEYKNA